MAGRLAGKVALMTGATTSGIGLGTAKAGAKEGAKLVFNARGGVGAAPGPVNTLVTLTHASGFEAYRTRNPQEMDSRISKSAMPRMGDPVRHIGGAAVFMVSEHTRYLAGSLTFADGGDFLATPVVEISMKKAA